MIIRDPIYGRFETPPFLDRLIMAPEVRRLMEIRLLNTPSPSLPTLSEIRRFSHTMGVLHLALTNPHIGLPKEELRAFLAAILIHDAATPPFAHLLEYYLKDRAGWSHELALPELLTGHHVFENVAHQILPGEELKFRRLCDLCDVDFDIVLQIVNKAHASSALLFGTLDFDNLDNVQRMAWALGLGIDSGPFRKIASELSTTLDGELMLTENLSNEVDVWARARSVIYEILVFDEMTVASQAVLTKAIRMFFDGKQTTDINWSGRDRDLLELLGRAPETKSLMLRHFFELLPSQMLAIRIRGSLEELGFSTRDRAIEFVEEIARNEVGIKRPFGYVFVDRGTFSKKIVFIDPATRKKWDAGVSSRSVVFYCFANESGKAKARIVRSFKDVLLKAVGRSGTDVDDGTTKTRLTG